MATPASAHEDPEPFASQALFAARALATALLPLALLALASPRLRLAPMPALGLTFLSACSAIVLHTGLARLAPQRAPTRALRGISLGAALMAAGYALARRSAEGAALDGLGALVNTAGVLLLGASLGGLIGGRVLHLGHLTAVALLSSAADVWSVHAPEGVTRTVVLAARNVAAQRVLTVSAVVPPYSVFEATVGLGDVVFCALYVAAVTQHEGPSARPRALAAITLGLALAGAATFALQSPTPALPFLGLAVLLVVPGARRVQRGDRAATALAGVALLLALARVLLPRLRR